MASESSRINAGVLLNEIGAQHLENGELWCAAESFKMALRLLLLDADGDATASATDFLQQLWDQSDDKSIISVRNNTNANGGDLLLFSDAITCTSNVAHTQQQQQSESPLESTACNSSSGSLFLTLAAQTLLNLATTLHRLGIATAKQSCFREAKILYQAVLHVVPCIVGQSSADDGQHPHYYAPSPISTVLAVRALLNVAVLHYTEFLEYADCRICLQSLCWIGQQHALDTGVLLSPEEQIQISLAIFFYAEPPKTAACA